MSQRKPDFYKFISEDPVLEIDLYKLKPGLLYAFLSDKTTVFGTFKSPSDAAKQLDGNIDSHYIRRYINLERPVIVGPLRIPVYFVRLTDWKNYLTDCAGYKWKPHNSSLNKAIILVDTI
jgi:hypothetical protein